MTTNAIIKKCNKELCSLIWVLGEHIYKHYNKVDGELKEFSLSSDNLVSEISIDVWEPIPESEDGCLRANRVGTINFVDGDFVVICEDDREYNGNMLSIDDLAGISAVMENTFNSLKK